VFGLVQRAHLLIRGFDFRGVVLAPHGEVDAQPGFGFGFTYEADDGGAIDQRLVPKCSWGDQPAPVVDSASAPQARRAPVRLG
jgi:hypothetical protein